MDDHVQRGRRPLPPSAANADQAAELAAKSSGSCLQSPNRCPKWSQYTLDAPPLLRNPSFTSLRERVFAEEKPQGAIAEAYLEGWCVNHATGMALHQYSSAFQTARLLEGLDRALRPFVPMDGERARLVRSFGAGDEEAVRKVEAFIPVEDLRAAACGEVVVAHCAEIEALARIQKQAFGRRDQDLQAFRRLQARSARLGGGGP